MESQDNAPRYFVVINGTGRPSVALSFESNLVDSLELDRNFRLHREAPYLPCGLTSRPHHPSSAIPIQAIDIRGELREASNLNGMSHFIISC